MLLGKTVNFQKLKSNYEKKTYDDFVFGPYKPKFGEFFPWAALGDFFWGLNPMWITSLWVLYRRKKKNKSC